MKFQVSKVLLGIMIDMFVFGIILFFRGRFLKNGVNKFFVDLFFFGVNANHYGE